MAGNFCDLFVCLIQQCTTISGGYGVGNILIIKNVIQLGNAVFWIGRSWW
mgnify:CR=1 FL=1